MKKTSYHVFSFVGSCAGEHSHTQKISDRLVEKLIRKAEERGEDLRYECMTGEHLRIDFCRSCLSCFQKGFCPLDQNDDMQLLKHKLLEADIILFCTPVYNWEMSGMTKCVLDRISYWNHRFELAGKTGAVIASADATHGPDFIERFQMLLQFTGMVVADGFTVLNSGTPCLYHPEEIEPLLERTAQKIMDTAEDPAAFIPEIQEKMWQSRMRMNQKKMLFYGLRGEEPWNEVQICQKRKMDEYSSYADYVRECFRSRSDRKSSLK